MGKYQVNTPINIPLPTQNPSLNETLTDETVEDRKNKIKTNIVYLSKNFQIVLTEGQLKLSVRLRVQKLNQFGCKKKEFLF